VADPLIRVAAMIPLIGAGAAWAVKWAYNYAVTQLHDLCWEKVISLLELILSKTVRPVLSAIFNAVKGPILKMVQGICSLQYPEACPKAGFRFAALPERSRWLDRALACRGRPLIGRKDYRAAAQARVRMQSIFRDLERNASNYATDLAGKMLARVGFTFEGWMAAVRTWKRPALLARAAEIRGALQRLGEHFMTKSRR
jgi:hypothetical protein